MLTVEEQAEREDATVRRFQALCRREPAYEEDLTILTIFAPPADLLERQFSERGA